MPSESSYGGLEARVCSLEKEMSNLIGPNGTLNQIYTKLEGLRDLLVETKTLVSVQKDETTTLRSKVSNIELKMACAAGAGAIITFLLTQLSKIFGG